MNQNYSSHKLAAAALLIRGRHLFDAFVIIENSEKKGGPIVKGVLESAKQIAIKKGY